MNDGNAVRNAIAFGATLFQYGVSFLALLIIIVGCSLGVLVALQLRTVPDLAFLEHYHPVDAIEIYDKNDQLVCAINHEDNRKTVDLNHISKYMQTAVIAAEDRHFYEHHGVNYKSILRALSVNVLAGRVVEGGSTITQQLVKNLFFPEARRTLVRKIAEAIVAEQIEDRYTKQQILSMYLNEIYFGNGATGIEQASQIYFGKTSEQLTLSESAFLAAVINAPSVIGSVQHRREALERQSEILDAMAEYGYVSPMEARIAKRSRLFFQLVADRQDGPPFTKYPYYVSYVLDVVHQRYDENQIRRSGLRVYTNLDPVAQTAAEQLLAKQIKSAPRGIDEEALVSIGVKDGAVRAIVGGAGDYWVNQWNSATNAHTVGSAFKPFVYLTAFLNDTLTPESKIDDTPLTVNQVDMVYTPKNYDGRFMGKVSVRDALKYSRNIPAVRVAQMVGVDNIVKTAKMAGITTPLQGNLSLALGSCALTPLEMASAYGTFARGGVQIEPWTIRHVDDLNAHVIDKEDPVACRTLPEEPVALLVDVLEDVVRGGTGTQARLGDRPVAGKTGTADQARDLWFIGFTPDMVTAVWGGNRKNQAISDKHVTGGSVMARVWRDYNRTYYAKSPTPAGTLIAAKTAMDPQKQAEIDARLNAMSSASSSNSQNSSEARRVDNPARGTVTRNHKGVTEYSWSH
jgi:1A family penicillin-binding protein